MPDPHRCGFYAARWRRVWLQDDLRGEVPLTIIEVVLVPRVIVVDVVFRGTPPRPGGDVTG